MKEIRELEKTKEDLRKDMVKMNTLVAKNDAKSKELTNANQMMETEFVPVGLNGKPSSPPKVVSLQLAPQ